MHFLGVKPLKLDNDTVFLWDSLSTAHYYFGGVEGRAQRIAKYLDASAKRRDHGGGEAGSEKNRGTLFSPLFPPPPPTPRARTMRSLFPALKIFTLKNTGGCERQSIFWKKHRSAL